MVAQGRMFWLFPSAGSPSLPHPPRADLPLIGMKSFHARLHPYILRAGSWEDQGTHLKFSDGSCQPRGVEAVLSEQTQVPVELQDVSGVVFKLLLPGQEDVSHLLLAFPAVKERGTGPQELSLVSHSP